MSELDRFPCTDIERSLAQLTQDCARVCDELRGIAHVAQAPAFDPPCDTDASTTHASLSERNAPACTSCPTVSPALSPFVSFPASQPSEIACDKRHHRNHNDNNDCSSNSVNYAMDVCSITNNATTLSLGDVLDDLHRRVLRSEADLVRHLATLQSRLTSAHRAAQTLDRQYPHWAESIARHHRRRFVCTAHNSYNSSSSTPRMYSITPPARHHHDPQHTHSTAAWTPCSLSLTATPAPLSFGGVSHTLTPSHSPATPMAVAARPPLLPPSSASPSVSPAVTASAQMLRGSTGIHALSEDSSRNHYSALLCRSDEAITTPPQRATATSETATASTERDGSTQRALSQSAATALKLTPTPTPAHAAVAATTEAEGYEAGIESCAMWNGVWGMNCSCPEPVRRYVGQLLRWDERASLQCRLPPRVMGTRDEMSYTDRGEEEEEANMRSSDGNTHACDTEKVADKTIETDLAVCASCAAASNTTRSTATRSQTVVRAAAEKANSTAMMRAGGRAARCSPRCAGVSSGLPFVRAAAVSSATTGAAVSRITTRAPLRRGVARTTRVAPTHPAPGRSTGTSHGSHYTNDHNSTGTSMTKSSNRNRERQMANFVGGIRKSSATVGDSAQSVAAVSTMHKNNNHPSTSNANDETNCGGGDSIKDNLAAGKGAASDESDTAVNLDALWAMTQQMLHRPTVRDVVDKMLLRQLEFDGVALSPNARVALGAALQESSDEAARQEVSQGGEYAPKRIRQSTRPLTRHEESLLACELRRGVYTPPASVDTVVRMGHSGHDEAELSSTPQRHSAPSLLFLLMEQTFPQLSAWMSALCVCDVAHHCCVCASDSTHATPPIHPECSSSSSSSSSPPSSASSYSLGAPSQHSVLTVSASSPRVRHRRSDRPLHRRAHRRRESEAARNGHSASNGENKASTATATTAAGKGKWHGCSCGANGLTPTATKEQHAEKAARCVRCALACEARRLRNDVAMLCALQHLARMPETQGVLCPGSSACACSRDHSNPNKHHASRCAHGNRSRHDSAHRAHADEKGYLWDDGVLQDQIAFVQHVLRECGFDRDAVDVSRSPNRPLLTWNDAMSFLGYEMSRTQMTTMTQPQAVRVFVRCVTPFLHHWRHRRHTHLSQHDAHYRVHSHNDTHRTDSTTSCAALDNNDNSNHHAVGFAADNTASGSHDHTTSHLPAELAPRVWLDATCTALLHVLHTLAQRQREWARHAHSSRSRSRSRNYANTAMMTATTTTTRTKAVQGTTNTAPAKAGGVGGAVASSIHAAHIEAMSPGPVRRKWWDLDDDMHAEDVLARWVYPLSRPLLSSLTEYDARGLLLSHDDSLSDLSDDDHDGSITSSPSSSAGNRTTSRDNIHDEDDSVTEQTGLRERASESDHDEESRRLVRRESSAPGDGNDRVNTAEMERRLRGMLTHMWLSTLPSAQSSEDEEQRRTTPEQAQLMHRSNENDNQDANSSSGDTNNNSNEEDAIMPDAEQHGRLGVVRRAVNAILTRRITLAISFASTTLHGPEVFPSQEWQQRLQEWMQQPSRSAETALSPEMAAAVAELLMIESATATSAEESAARDVAHTPPPPPTASALTSLTTAPTTTAIGHVETTDTASANENVPVTTVNAPRTYHVVGRATAHRSAGMGDVRAALNSLRRTPMALHHAGASLYLNSVLDRFRGGTARHDHSHSSPHRHHRASGHSNDNPGHSPPNFSGRPDHRGGGGGAGMPVSRRGGFTDTTRSALMLELPHATAVLTSQHRSMKTAARLQSSFLPQQQQQQLCGLMVDAWSRTEGELLFCTTMCYCPVTQRRCLDPLLYGSLVRMNYNMSLEQPGVPTTRAHASAQSPRTNTTAAAAEAGRFVHAAPPGSATSAPSMENAVRLLPSALTDHGVRISAMTRQQRNLRVETSASVNTNEEAEEEESSDSDDNEQENDSGGDRTTSNTASATATATPTGWVTRRRYGGGPAVVLTRPTTMRGIRRVGTSAPASLVSATSDAPDAAVVSASAGQTSSAPRASSMVVVSLTPIDAAGHRRVEVTPTATTTTSEDNKSSSNHSSNSTASVGAASSSSSAILSGVGMTTRNMYENLSPTRAALLNAPQLLPCGHIMAHKVLLGICAAQRRDPAEGKVRCPYCSQDVSMKQMLTVSYIY